MDKNSKFGLYLGIATTEKESGIAIIENNKILYEKIEETNAHHNETIFTYLDNAFKSLSISPNQINGIGVVIGPGMFTSLRVGLACAKGLATTNNIKVKGFNTLDALVFSLPIEILAEKRTIIPSIDVRRNEIYFRVYKGLEPITDATIARPEIFSKKIIKDAIVLGSGINRYIDIIKSSAKINFSIHNLRYPKPSAVAFQTQESITKNDVSNIETLVPFYAR